MACPGAKVYLRCTRLNLMAAGFPPLHSHSAVRAVPTGPSPHLRRTPQVCHLRPQSTHTVPGSTPGLPRHAPMAKRPTATRTQGSRTVTRAAGAMNASNLDQSSRDPGFPSSCQHSFNHRGRSGRRSPAACRQCKRPLSAVTAAFSAHDNAGRRASPGASSSSVARARTVPHACTAVTELSLGQSSNPSTILQHSLPPFHRPRMGTAKSWTPLQPGTPLACSPASWTRMAVGRRRHASGRPTGARALAPGALAATDDPRSVRFCHKCGAPTEHRVPQGDDKPRDVCSSPSCGVVHYENPKVVVGAVCLWAGQVLLCKRAIEPCKGLWGFPQGFMEMGESTREGAEREALEEAGARIQIRDLLAVYNIPNQVQIIYLADLVSPETSAGFESLEVELFAVEDIPFQELAFPTVGWALNYMLSLDLHVRPICPQQRTKVFKFDERGQFIPGLYKDE